MHFSTISVLAVLSSIARALPQVGTAPTPTPEPITRFTIQVYNTGTALHNKVIHASGRYFSLGLDGPSTFCPLIGGPFEDACPPGDETVVYGGGISLA